ncbi:MAG: cupredoxin domain-containing protein [Bdellovibrionales bacterium]|nr:cupredoxin domain-containing protein [Bdellovibrionales bacterium]
MDRFIRTLGLALALGLAGTAAAEVVFVAPTATQEDDGDTFPESRFGSPPEQPLSGGRANRAPAGRAAPAQETYRAVEEDAPFRAARPGTGDRDRSYGDIIPDRTKGVQEVAIIAGDLGFFPKTVFVTRDIPVRMYVTGAARSSLCIMMDSFHVRKQVRSQEIQEISFTPSATGNFRFYCPVNGMEGTLVVKELSASR